MTSLRTITYTYDGLLRLIGATESGATTNTYAYGYDLGGNRTSATVNDSTTTRTYNAANQVTNVGWSYDNVGNRLSDGTTTYTFDALNRHISTGSTTNAYNGDGVLVAQTTGGTTTCHETQELALAQRSCKRQFYPVSGLPLLRLDQECLYIARKMRKSPRTGQDDVIGFSVRRNL